MKKLLSSPASAGAGVTAGAGEASGGSTAVMEGRSVFHTKLRTNACQPNMDETLDSVHKYVDSLVQFCGAGSHVSQQFASLLGATVYGNISSQFEIVAKEVEAAIKVEGNQVKTDVETYWSQLGRSYEGEKSDGESTISDDIKIVAKSLVRLMQTHCQFFLSTSEIFAQFSKVGSLEDLGSTSLPTTEDTSHTASYEPTPTEHLYNKTAELPQQDVPVKSAELKSSQNVDSPSRLRKHISSFFSKKLGGGKSGSGSGDSTAAVQSSFYVQTPHNNGDHEAGTSNSVMPDKTGKVDKVSETAGQASIDVGAGAGPHDSGAVVGEPAGAGDKTNTTTSSGELFADATQTETGKGGHLASQEELDSVIDLLSGFPKYGGLPPTASAGSGIHHNPEGLPPKHPAAPTAASLSASSKAVGSHLSHTASLPPHVPPSGVPGVAGFPNNMFSHPPPQLPVDPPFDSSLLGSRTHQHRRSDGLIGETLNRGNQKTNTWPYRPQQRDALPHSTAAPAMSPYSSNTYDGHISDAEYSRYLAAVKQMKQNNSQSTAGAGSSSLLHHSNMWSTGDNSGNRTWPSHIYPHNGHEGPIRPWTGAVGDSSSCSDESSNGETPWMMGIDLVSAMDKRRHSSGDESYPSGPASTTSTSEPRPHSVEDLLETKVNNTWPGPVKQQQHHQNQQPWGQNIMAPGMVEPSAMPSHMHPPLQMQWSDPLTNRPLTTWGSGLTGALSHQSLQMYTGLTGTVHDQVPPPHPNLDNTYPIIS